MQRRDVRLSPWSLDIEREPIRLPPRRPALRHEDFEDRYDFTTVFYDCFWEHAGETIALIGPPLLNLERDLDLSFLAAPSLARCESSVSHTYLGCRVRLAPPPGTTGLVIRSSVGEAFVAPQPSLCELFRDRRAIFTLSRNNELTWIRDWVHFNRRYHGCDAVLIYDNGSARYGVNDIYDHLAPIMREIPVVVLSWPFSYGVFDGRVPVSYELWDSQYCQTGVWDHARRRFLALARSVLNSDIDELVLTDDRSSVFDLVEGSATGFVSFDGVWVENFPPAGEGRNRHLPRHKDFAHVSTAAQVGCESKWAVVPARVPDTAQWEIHHVLGMPLSDTRQAVEIRHFKAINTNWDVDHKRTGTCRTAPPQADPTSLRLDTALRNTLDDIFIEMPEEPLAPVPVPTPSDAYSWRVRAARLAARGRGRAALAAMGKALALMPDHPGFRLFAARLLDRARQQPEASRQRAAAEELRRRDPWFWFQHGRWLADLGDLPAAEASFVAAIGLDPRLTPAYHELARIRDYEGQGSRAEEWLEACARQVPDDPATRALLAERAIGGGAPREALPQIDAALALEPGNPHHHWLRARALRTLGRLDDAETALRQGLALDGIASRMETLGRQSASLGALCFYFHIAPADYRGAPMAPALLAEHAEILLERGDVEGAATAAREALSLSRTNPKRHALLASALARSGDQAGAGQALDAAIALARQEMRRPTLNTMPLTTRTGYWEWRAECLADLLVVAGRVEEAVAALLKAIGTLAAGGRLHERLSTLLAGSGRWQDAAAILRSAIKAAPADPRLRHALGKVLAATAPDEAVAAAAAAVELEPRQRYYHDQLVTLLMAAGRQDEAEAALVRAFEVGLQHAPLFYRRGQLLRGRGRAGEALAAARAAVDLQPRAEYLRDFLVELLFEAGRLDDAVSVLDDGRQLGVTGGRPHFRLSRILMRQCRAEEALAAAARAVELEPDAAYIRENLAGLLLGAGRSPAAEAVLRHAVALAPDAAGCHHQLSRALERLGRLDEAIAAARRAVELEPGQRHFQDQLAAVLIAADQLDEAEAVLDVALALGLHHAPLYYRRSWILRRRGRLGEAIEAAAEAVALEPATDYLLENNAALLLDAGRIDAAEAMLDEALAVVPGRAGLHFHRSRILQQRGLPEEALAAARRAVELEPGQAWLQGFLAWRLGDVGRGAEAIEALERAVALDPRLADYPFWLSQFLRRERRFGDAVRSARTAIELDPDRAVLQEHLVVLVRDAGEAAGGSVPAGDPSRDL